ncbi:MAG: Maf family nucleotide pyrophosphatase [Bernardetiaceae bacterium]|jgi:septum formation protein|nr:Maf family nucleotide pyrophosphatase [Bernardetiaceae bacterium]
MLQPYPYRLILASGSPRRQQLLRELGLPYRQWIKPIDEIVPPHVAALDAASYLAAQKAAAFEGQIAPDELVITADTVVICQGQLLGKPADAAEARQMLSLLAGQAHEVITGVCLHSQHRTLVQSDLTRVHFRALSQAEIDFYIQHYQPFDKAGAYGAQDWVGMVAIERLEGSYFNVMGLPTHLLYQMLLNFVAS